MAPPRISPIFNFKLMLLAICLKQTSSGTKLRAVSLKHDEAL